MAESEKKLRITKDSTLRMVEALKESGRFSTYNDVLNAALEIGLPILLSQKPGDGNVEAEEKAPAAETVDNQELVLLLNELIRILKEESIGVALNKSMICSLFEAKRLELKGEPISGAMFETGLMSTTPQYLTLSERNLYSEAKQKK